MSVQPLITFKAGQCEFQRGDNPTVKPLPTPGYIYLYMGDDFVHFCWRPRSSPVDQGEIDLLMIPGDAAFQPYIGSEEGADSENLKSPTDGRIFVLKFSSSPERYLFWLQSKSQHPRGDPSWFSERDLKIGQVVDLLLSGEEVDVNGELASVQNRGPSDEDEAMEDVEGTDHDRNRNRTNSTGGAGPDATGGDIREEGEESREGGADGGRAAVEGSADTSALVQNFLNSLKGGSSGAARSSEDPFTTLLDLLSPNTTIPVIDKAPDSLVDSLCENLPPTILLLAQEIEGVSEIDPNSEVAQAAIEALDQDQKRDILRRVLRSPQMRQSLGSLTVALRDGGLPNVSQALKIDVQNGGFIRGGGMPLGGGDAVKAFLEGVKKTVEKEKGDEMDTD
ncbi:proteasome complex subunit Rpn13 ubiquitin receptor-domain-containing protein [Lophiotrema nucula]|uniref:Proteasome complex subunit Rpn13 ubiquitin receptor-domain-containing protein n=1 Tax=Lophiotrema nucula TaxID=690887 RepID=A0A6A5ZNX5_9PLEO|nr:proteasome complex subunit Rpn13 ubiquitin receptor-domain-containing protein [Lophiotrema nucula]